jgi:tRNA dimethylallyltransferase
MSRPRLVCVVGPTASGKSSLALELATALGAEIVSADSRQIYRGLDIGTAKPTPAERARVPHHCLDLIEPSEAFDAARFRAAAAGAIADAHRRGRPVLVVGGTGLYLRALLHGLCPAPPRSPVLRALLESRRTALGAPALHRALRAVDGAAAARIHPQDAVRIVRALEVVLSTGRPLSAWQARHRFAEQPYDALVIGLVVPPAALDARIAARVQAMMDAGLLDEVRALAARGVGRDAPGLRTVGYREMWAAIAGETSVRAALDATVLATRRYAKRQRTWFRGDPAMVWRRPEEGDRIRAEVAGFFQEGPRCVASP